MYKVKYNKREYSEYLESPEWKRLRDYVIEQHPICEKCGLNKSTEVHHLQYKQIVNVSPHDLMAVCHECHTDIHFLIKVNKLNQTGHSIYLKKQTISFKKQDIEKIRKWRNQKHFIPDYLIYKLKKSTNHARRKSFAVIGIGQTYDDEKIKRIKISGCKIEELKRILKENKKIARQNKKTVYSRKKIKPGMIRY